MTGKIYPQLDFKIENKDEINNKEEDNTIYITDDPNGNKLTFVISAANVDKTTFTPGKPVPKKEANKATGSLLYLDLTNLELGTDEFSKNLEFKATGWQFKPYIDEVGDGKKMMICLTPTSKITMAAGEKISIEINKMVISNTRSPGNIQLSVNYYRVENITSGDSPLISNFKVLLQHPPDAEADLHQDLQIEVDNKFIVSNDKDGYNPISNKLSLIFKLNSQTEIKADDNTAFTVTFVYADENTNGFGALTTVKNAQEFKFQAKVNADQWTPTKKGQMEELCWELKPTKGTILKPGSKSTVQFDIDNILTKFQPGPTLMMIYYVGIPGYRDGAYFVLLEKVPHVCIKTLSISPNPAPLLKGEATIDISWEAYDAESLLLMPWYDPVPKKGIVTKKIDVTTSITLTALGKGGSSNLAVRHEVAKVLPVINSFIAKPSAIYQKDFPQKVEFSWNVDTKEWIKLKSSIEGPEANLYDHIGNVTKTIYQPQMMSLIPDKDENNPLLRRNLIVSAFKTVREDRPISSAASFVASAPNAGLIAVTQTAQDKLCILDTMVYNEIVDPIKTGKKPLGVAFSKDGSLIFVANSGDGTVSIIQVEATGSIPPYNFNNTDTVSVGGSPQQVAASPDGNYLYITVDNSAVPNKKGSLSILQKQEGNKFTQLKSVDIGPSPRGIAVSPSGAQIFAANSGDNTISCIGLSSQGEHMLVGAIGNLNQPTGLVVTPDGKTLLVACSGSNTVFGINTEFPDTSPRQVFDVGKSPQQIAIVPGGVYAFVTNQDDNTVSLLNYKADYKDCVLEKNIPVGLKPNGIVVSSEGGLLIVANKEQNNLTILALTQYQESTQPVKIGNMPTNVAASSDGSKIFAWHNSLLDIESEMIPFKGFYVYETTSKTVTPHMQDSEIIGCVFSPDPKAHTAFITIEKQNFIAVLDTTTYQTVNTISIHGKNRYPQNLAISSDGTRLFTLAYNGESKYSLIVFSLDNNNEILTDIDIFTTSAASFTYLSSSSDGSKIFAINSVDEQLWIARRNEKGTYEVDKSSISVGFAPCAMTSLLDGSKVFVLNKDNTMTNNITIVEPDSLKVSTFYLPGDITSVSINDIVVSPDGTKIFATDGVHAGIRVIDATSLRFLQTISWRSNVQFPFCIAVLPDGSQIFTANMFSNSIGIIEQVHSVKKTV